MARGFGCSSKRTVQTDGLLKEFDCTTFHVDGIESVFAVGYCDGGGITLRIEEITCGSIAEDHAVLALDGLHPTDLFQEYLL